MPFRALTLIACLVAAPLCAQQFERGARNTDLQPAFDAQFRAPLKPSGISLRQKRLADGLEHPWAIAVLPGEAGYLVTERAGRLRHVSRDGTVSAPISGVPDVLAQKQGGLLDVALSPDFATSRRIYLTYAKPVGRGLSATSAAYATLSDDYSALSGVTDIFVQTPGSTAAMHYGSRVLFDDAGHVFITTGEHSTRKYRVYAQDLDKTYGKVIRLTMDGQVPSDNPFVGRDGVKPEIWTLGHRNVQGALFLGKQLYTIEHGPAGGDELNAIAPGKNYGWPVISYGENYGGSPIGSGKAQMPGMEQPVYFWDPVIAPSGATAYDGEMFEPWRNDILIGSLYPGGIVRLDLADGRVTAEERLAMPLGRVRDVAVDHDGAILVVTDYANGEFLRLSR